MRSAKNLGKYKESSIKSVKSIESIAVALSRAESWERPKVDRSIELIDICLGSIVKCRLDRFRGLPRIRKKWFSSNRWISKILCFITDVQIMSERERRQTEVTQITHCHFWNIFDDMCWIGWASFLSLVGVNQSIFWRRYAQKIIWTFLSTSDVDLTWNLLPSYHVSKQLAVCTALRFWLKWRHGMDIRMCWCNL